MQDVKNINYEREESTLRECFYEVDSYATFIFNVKLLSFQNSFPS